MKRVEISPERIEEGLRATAASKKFNPNPSIPVNTEASGVRLPGTAETIAPATTVPVTTPAEELEN
jgi:hypothetical protein